MNACRSRKLDLVISFNLTIWFGNQAYCHDHWNLKFIFMICDEWFNAWNEVMIFRYFFFFFWEKNDYFGHLLRLNYGCKIEYLHNAFNIVVGYFTCVVHPRWVLDHLLGHEWEVPLGGRNLIPLRHLGFYLLPLNFLSSLYFIALPLSPFEFLAIPTPLLLLLLIYIYIYISYLDTKKKKSFILPKWCLNTH